MGDLTGVPAGTGPGDRYGYGSQILQSPLGDSYGHSGFMPGYLSIVIHYPDHGLTVAVQILSDDVRAVGARPRTVAQRIADVLTAD